MPIVDPRHLLQFHEIIRTGSFTRAAMTLGLTQPALTRNMKLMESRLGFELMVRSRQGIMPTPLGERILEEASAIVLAERRISTLTDNLRRGYEAELRVGCTPTLSLHALAQPVANFARENPEVRLEMRQAHSQTLADMLNEGKVDLALGPPKITSWAPGASSCILFKSPMVILASRHHPLVGRTAVTKTDLEAARWALHQPGSGIRVAADRLLAQIGLSESLQANELPSNIILSLLRMGDHLAVVPRYIPATTPLAGDLVQIDIGQAQVSLSHMAVWRERSATPVVGRFVEHMRQSLNLLGEISERPIKNERMNE